MNTIALIICAFGTCFNPSQITYMETQHISGDCKINFTRNSSSLTIPDHSCEEVSAEINKQILEKSGK